MRDFFAILTIFQEITNNTFTKRKITWSAITRSAIRRLMYWIPRLRRANLSINSNQSNQEVFLVWNALEFIEPGILITNVHGNQTILWDLNNVQIKQKF